MRFGQNISLQTIYAYSWIPIFSPMIRAFHNELCCCLTLHLHKVTVTTESFITACHRLFDSVRMNVRVLCYQPSVHNCSHIAIFFTIVAATILLQRWGQSDSRSETNSLDVITIVEGSLVTILLYIYFVIYALCIFYFSTLLRVVIHLDCDAQILYCMA